MPDELRGSAAEDQELGICMRSIGEYPEDGKQVGSELNFVEDDESGESAEGEFRVGESEQIGG